MVVDSILPHAESGPNNHRKDASVLTRSELTDNLCFLVCSTYLPHLSPDDFHSHVDSHFDEDESDFFELMNRAD